MGARYTYNFAAADTAAGTIRAAAVVLARQGRAFPASRAIVRRSCEDLRTYGATTVVLERGPVEAGYEHYVGVTIADEGWMEVDLEPIHVGGNTCEGCGAPARVGYRACDRCEEGITALCERTPVEW